MDEGKNVDDSVEKAKKNLKVSLWWFFSSLKDLLIDVLSIRKGANIEGTVESIKKDSEFKGHNVWILIFSIIIACIGLNTNSVAIVIGAMLISPLMGPILGIGYGLGTNDINTLALALKNLLIAVFVAIFTSYIYFKLTPFTNEQPELLSRTKPHLLDVFISIFGGLAGIIANSRSERSNVIPGVAIATALMPPLCTAGYGLATGHYDYFFGAFYLFLLNAAGISVTTLVVVKYMQFPLVHFLNEATEKKVKWFVFMFWVLLIVPSFFMFYNLITEEVFKKKVKDFVTNELDFDNSFLVKDAYEYNRDSTSIISLYFYGEVLDSTVENNLEEKLLAYGLNDCDLIIHQDQKNSAEFQQKLSEVESSFDFIYDETSTAIEFQNAKIAEIQKKLQSKSDSIDLIRLKKECDILFPSIQQIGYSNMQYTVKDSIYNLPTFYILSQEGVKIDNTALRKWLKLRSGKDTIRLLP